MTTPQHFIPQCSNLFIFRIRPQIIPTRNNLTLAFSPRTCNKFPDETRFAFYISRKGCAV